MSNRMVIERYWKAFVEGDWEEFESCLHPDIVVRYPQSGEVIRGRANYMAVIRAYPGGLPKPEAARLTGDERTVVVPSSQPFAPPLVTVTGGDELYIGEAKMTYADGTVYHTASILRIKDRLVVEDTTYFAAPFEAPEWRSPYTEG